MDVSIALILGGVLGLEREWKQKPAGLRTNMIIAGSAALLVSLGRVVVQDFGTLAATESFGVDPIRMLHAVIVGVSFIGAGTILKSTSKTMVRYLTTSATILMAAGIGISIALKQYMLGAGATVILVTVNFLFTRLNKWVYKISDYESPYSK
ncbi:MAG: MgtC/SapB family protein [Gracilimonas sp.]|nr:MgtC/SapB family protein [Gracilimonas sp.]MBO6615494.1 MgtC/SapB family protein [Gracilimonas sp.]